MAHREERLAGIAVCISTADHEVATIGLRATRGPFRAAHPISVDDRVVGWLSADMRFIAGTDDDTVVLIHPPTGSFSTVEYTLGPSGPYTAPFFRGWCDSTCRFLWGVFSPPRTTAVG